MPRLVDDPPHDQVLAFCAREPVERVFLEEMAVRAIGHFVALVGDDGQLEALCHAGANLVPSGRGCEEFAETAIRSNSRMIIGEERAVEALWDASAPLMPVPRENRPGQPVYTITEPPASGESGLRRATLADLERLLPACAAAHELELGLDPRRRDDEGFRWRVRNQIEEGRSWLWIEDDVILFKAEASAWTQAAVQVQQVWTDPEARGRGNGSRGLRDLCRLLLETTPIVTLFVRTNNLPAIRLYESIGMQHVLSYRSILFP
jgi:ribosomal protein S18 acetylase RimI-like enzyme